MNDVYRRGGKSVTFMLVLITEHHTAAAAAALSSQLPARKKGHDHGGHMFFNNELFGSVQDVKIPL